MDNDEEEHLDYSNSPRGSLSSTPRESLGDVTTHMSPVGAVKVAVRVRPMNEREIQQSARCIVQMSGNTTVIENPKVANDVEFGKRTFAFDFSYDSMDESRPQYASQERVFGDLGMDIIESAFKGYNACLFAYGQTGSGKSYSMMGYDEDNMGLIPRICEGIFRRVSLPDYNNTKFNLQVSYLEIYNETVRDLLATDSSFKSSLRIRENPVTGPYVDELSVHTVSTYADILSWMARGNAHRITAATHMNDSSSRSHAVFTLNFSQACFAEGVQSERSSRINLVDLAGSERYTVGGVRGREGANINKSLSTLGLVIAALAERNPKKKTTTHVAYRDSVLTWLLKESLGGNSRTTMLATISPSNTAHAETLSTLHYANRAKNIVNQPTVNEDSNVRLIRQLKQEILRLKALLGGDDEIRKLEEAREKARRQLSHATSEEEKALALEAISNADTALSKVNQDHQNMEVIAARLQESERMMGELTFDWQNKWQQQTTILERGGLEVKESGRAVVVHSDLPHFISLQLDDVLHTGVTFHYLQQTKSTLGSDSTCDIVVSGQGVEPKHCIIEHFPEKEEVLLTPSGLCYVNNEKVTDMIAIEHGATVQIGDNNIFRFNYAAQAVKLKQLMEASPSAARFARTRTVDISPPKPLNPALLEEQQIEKERLEVERRQSLLELEQLKRVLLEKEQEMEKIRLATENEKKEAEEKRILAERLVEDERRKLEHQSMMMKEEFAQTLQEKDASFRQSLLDAQRKEDSRKMEEFSKLEQQLQLERLRAEQIAMEKQALEQRQRSMTMSLSSTLPPLSPSPPRASTSKSANSSVPFERAWFIEISGVFTRGEPQSGELYNVYELKFSLYEEKWRIYRRYSEFEMLHKRMRVLYPALVLGLKFPPKKWLPDKSFLAQRRQDLETYLIQLVRKGYSMPATPFYNANREGVTRAVAFFRPGSEEVVHL